MLIIVAIALLLVIWGIPPPVHAQSGLTAGSVSFSVPDSRGTSSYTLLYSYPSVITAGRNFNVTITLEIDSLTGLKLYLIEYSVAVTVSTSSGASVTRLVESTSPWLYPGSHWGPLDASLPISTDDFKVPPGESTMANVTLALGTEVWWDQPFSSHFPESASKSVGTVTILSAPGGGPNYPAFLGTVLAGTVAALGSAYAWDHRRRRGLKNP